MKLKDIKGLLPEKKQDHGYIFDGADDTQQCDCDECYSIWKHNKLIDEMGEKELCIDEHKTKNILLEIEGKDIHYHIPIDASAQAISKADIIRVVEK